MTQKQGKEVFQKTSGWRNMIENEVKGKGMSELYFTKPYRGSLKTLRLEFGEVKNKYLLKSFEGEDNYSGPHK